LGVIEFSVTRNSHNTFVSRISTILMML